MKIEKVIREYQEKGIYNDDITYLLELQGQISVYSFYMAERVGNLYLEFLQNEHNRKDEFNKIMLQETIENPVSKSEIKAREKTKQLRIDEKLAEGRYNTLKLQLNQVNQILNHLSIRISRLKQEWENSKRQV